MSVLNEEIIRIINDRKSLKSIATVSRDGIPHVAYKGSLHTEGENLVFYDLIQSSQINKNLVHAIWFGKKVAINILQETEDGRRDYLIIGHPEKCVTAGKAFEETYRKLQEKMGKDIDLSAIWYLTPESVRDETYRSRKEEEEKKFPYIKHLDRLTKKNEA